MAWKNLLNKNKLTNSVYEPYLKTTKLGYLFIALKTQKCGEFVLAIAWFQVQLTINLMSSN